ncbi:MAG: hypothetical protein GSR84_00770 [Desulfurococcales archaeon]|nr:hypothetical protein [Desulfurococcales archaeon]
MQGEVGASLVLALALALPGLAAVLAGDPRSGHPKAPSLAYMHVSKRVRARASRALGTVLILGGLASLAPGLLYGVEAQAGFIAVYVVASIPLITGYTRRLAELESLSLPPEGEPRPIPRLGTAGAALVVGSAVASLFLAVLAFIELHRIQASTVGIAILAVSMVPAYIAYLSLARPEAYASPGLGDDMVRLLQAASPVTASLLASTPSLAVLGVGGWWIAPILGFAASAALAVATYMAYR